MSKKAFLICPVRGVDPKTTEGFVRKLEAEGWEVHWPPRDTDQVDPTGLRICADNVAAIRAADKVFIVWDGNSKGSLFDAGAAFALEKEIECLSLPEPSEGKSFQNMFRDWEEKRHLFGVHEILEDIGG